MRTVAVVQDALFLQIISDITWAIEQAGYDPCEQLFGYLQTGHDYYITRNMGARDLIKSLNHDKLQEYVNSLQMRE